MTSMTTETVLHFFFKYNAVLIESLIVLILLMASLLAYRSFKQAKNESLGQGGTGGADLSQIEESLKKILEKANAVSPSSGGGAGEPPAALMNEIATLKADLQKKQNELEEARASASSSASTSGMSEEEKKGLEVKIEDLERKLSEFDIISQDIADLTMYRDENVKLKEEIENLKKAGPVAAAAPTPVAEFEPVMPEPSMPEPTPIVTEVPVESAPTPAPAPSIDSMDDLFNPTGEPTPAVEAAAVAEVPAAAPAPAAESPNVVDDDLMAEFAAALAEQSGVAKPAPAASEPEVTPQDKDLMGKFENFVNKENKT